MWQQPSYLWYEAGWGCERLHSSTHRMSPIGRSPISELTLELPFFVIYVPGIGSVRTGANSPRNLAGPCSSVTLTSPPPFGCVSASTYNIVSAFHNLPPINPLPVYCAYGDKKRSDHVLRQNSIYTCIYITRFSGSIISICVNILRPTIHTCFGVIRYGKGRTVACVLLLC